MEGNRFRSIDNLYVNQQWFSQYSNYTAIENTMVPMALEVVWNTQAGNFSYANLL